MTKRRSIAEASNRLPSLVRDAESGQAVELTRRGEPVAVLIGRQQCARLASRHLRFSEAYGSFVQEVNLAELAIDPAEVLAGLRDETRGRVVDL